MRRSLSKVGAIMVCMGLVVFGSASAIAAEVGARERVSLRLKWRHQFQFAGYYAALAKGYYRDAGLDVNLIEAAPGEDTVAAVLRGEAEFGVGTSELLLLRGKGQPVVVLAAIFQHSPLVLLAKGPGTETDLEGLYHKPLMIEPQSAELFAYFRNEGMDPARLNIVNHSFSVEDLTHGRVAAMTGYSTDEPFLLQQAGVEFSMFSPRAGGIDFYGDNLFTTEAMVRKKPAVVKAFLEASLRGWEYALANPEEIIDLIIEKYGSAKSREHLRFEAERTTQLMHPGLIEIGHMNQGRWRHMADTYAEFGMLPRNFDVTPMLYDPNPPPNLRPWYWAFGILAAVSATALGWITPLVRMNRRLRKSECQYRQLAEELRRAKEDAEAANAARRRYMAMMSHDIRTPLNAIFGFADFMLNDDQPLNDDQRQNLVMMRDASQSLTQLVTQMLDWSQLEAGAIKLDSQPVQLRELLENLVGLFRPSLEAKGVNLKLEIADATPETVITDPLRLRQILSNLVSNAVKFTSQGEVCVHCSADRLADARWQLSFAVSDTGPGMTPEVQAKLFAPYVQADAAVARTFGGSGLGLSISREMARLLGGDITLQSRVGSGSTFTFKMVTA